jgi:Cellulose biosynthesis protein BcsS
MDIGPRFSTKKAFFAMRLGVVAAPVVMIGFLSSPACAQDWYTGSRAGEKVERPRASIDFALTGTTQESYYGTIIGTIAPFAPLDESGMRLRLGGVLGSYTYVSSFPGVGRVGGKQEDGSFLVGYEWVTRNTSVAFYGGADVANNTLTKPDPSNLVTGVSFGLKASVDFYTNPTNYSMVSGNMTYSTANNSYYTRFKVGLAIADSLYVGPEALLLGDNLYSQYRAGLHLTGARFGSLQFGISGGFLNDRLRGKGAYGILDMRVVF